MRHFRKIASCAVLALLAACSKESQPTDRDIVTKVIANGGKPIAYLTRKFTGGGATGSTVYSVYLSGQPEHQLGESVLEALHSCGIQLEWKKGDILAVHYNGAECDIVKFKNYWYDPVEVKSQQYRRVEIVLLESKWGLRRETGGSGATDLNNES